MTATSVMLVGSISINGGAPQPCVISGVTTSPGGPVDPGYGISIERPSHPIAFPPGPVDPGYGISIERPSHPIVIVPPGAVDGTHPEHPIYLPVYPSHPIELPPNEPSPDPGFQWVYTDQFGWVLDPLGGGKPRPPGHS